ncbi:MAG: cytochrome c biogenesis CcdA family protein, partial [Planktothrix sp.]|uniref:cytochrome c biogenesis CcdA family protein n=1 Tax=Planktothrix sp. TaxID=3088171 RepID=UPI0038D50C7F
MLETLQLKLYELAQLANQLVQTQLTQISWVSIVVILMAGLLTSLTPCMLSMLPITIGYIGGYETQNRQQAAIQSIWFSLGLATTLAGLGILASFVGQVYGQIGLGWPIIVSVIAILMGLNLLEALPLQLPAFDTIEWIPKQIPHSLKSYLLGLTFGLVASPCSTPVLATLLAWVSTTGD